MPGFKSQLCHLLACDLGKQLGLSEPQFLPLSSDPMIPGLGKALALGGPIATQDQRDPGSCMGQTALWLLQEESLL